MSDVAMDEDFQGGGDRVAQLQARFASFVGQGAGAMAAEHGYERSDPVSGATLSAADEHTLQRMLLERVYAKRIRDFQAADLVRARLKDAGVSLNDGEKTYSIRPPAPAAATHHGYTRVDDSSMVISPSDQMVLEGMLLERAAAKRARDFALADRLRERLKEAGVLVDDAHGTYRLVSRQPQRAPHHGYTRADDGSVVFSPADQATLDALLLERVSAKRQRDFARANELHRQLLEAGVVTDDSARTYRIAAPPQAQAAAAPAGTKRSRGARREGWRGGGGGRAGLTLAPRRLL